MDHDLLKRYINLVTSDTMTHLRVQKKFFDSYKKGANFKTDVSRDSSLGFEKGP